MIKPLSFGTFLEGTRYSFWDNLVFTKGTVVSLCRDLLAGIRIHFVARWIVVTVLIDMLSGFLIVVCHANGQLLWVRPEGMN